LSGTASVRARPLSVSCRMRAMGCIDGFFLLR
jgi:hypothetical protein